MNTSERKISNMSKLIKMMWKLLIPVISSCFFVNVPTTFAQDDLLLSIPAIIGSQIECSSTDFRGCRDAASCSGVNGLFFEGSCVEKCTSANLRECRVVSECREAGGLFVESICRPNSGVISELAKMQGTWIFRSSFDTTRIFFDSNKIQSNSTFGFIIRGNIEGSPASGWLVYTPGIRLYEVLDVFEIFGRTGKLRQFKLNSATSGSGVELLTIDSQVGPRMSVNRASLRELF